jgi:NADH dehydrogenase (ubiquinone) Fe-S protein 4
VNQEKLLWELFSLGLQLTYKVAQSGLFLLSVIWRLWSNNLSIYKPSKPATQSGEWHGHHWRMDWDVLSKGHRWENPLMGWQSSADFVQGTHINFKTKEDAVRFADKQGYEYFVQEPNERKIMPKAYANNFLYSDKKLKHIRTK